MCVCEGTTGIEDNRKAEHTVQFEESAGTVVFVHRLSPLLDRTSRVTEENKERMQNCCLKPSGCSKTEIENF